MNSDPLADLLSRLRNAAKARQTSVSAPYSQLKEQIFRVLKEEGFLSHYAMEESAEKQKTLVGHLRTTKEGIALLEHIRRRSTPGQRVYTPAPHDNKIRGGLGFQILSTSQGVMTDRKAAQLKIGGEILAEVW